MHFLRELNGWLTHSWSSRFEIWNNAPYIKSPKSIDERTRRSGMTSRHFGIWRWVLTPWLTPCWPCRSRISRSRNASACYGRFQSPIGFQRTTGHEQLQLYNMTAQRLIGSVLLLLLFLSMIFSYAVGKYNMYILTFQLTLLSGSKFCENRKTMLTFLGRVKTCDLKLTCEQIWIVRHVFSRILAYLGNGVFWSFFFRSFCSMINSSFVCVMYLSWIPDVLFTLHLSPVNLKLQLHCSVAGEFHTFQSLNEKFER